jgi:small-conductance mechanosensitive channel
VEQARSVLNLTVLGAIPIIVSEEELRRGMQSRRRWMIVSISVVVVLLIGLSAVGFLYRNEILFRLGLF